MIQNQKPRAMLLDSVMPDSFLHGAFFEYKTLQTLDLANITRYDFVAFRSKTKITPEVIQATGNKMILLGRGGTGMDNVDAKSASQAGIITFGTPGENALPVAEGAFGNMIAAFHRLPGPMIQLMEGRWVKGNTGREICGKTIGIVGYGAIGSEMAKFALAFGMSVICYEINSKVHIPYAVRRVESLQELYAQSNAITLHVPLTDSTRNMINAEAIASMQPGTVLINTARGELVNPPDILEGVKSKQMIYIADVFLREPVDQNDILVSQTDLIKAGKLILTPHMLASTIEAQQRIAQRLHNEAKAFFTDATIPTAANIPQYGVVRVGKGGRLFATHKNVSGLCCE